MEEKELLRKALEAREKAYVPYSRFKVGAALLTKGGKVYTGCNVENASYGLTICAERVVLYKAISEGEKEFAALAVIGDTPTPCSPCGACRQVLCEFAKEMPVIMGNLQGDILVKTVDELLPGSFCDEDMKTNQRREGSA